MGRPDFVVASNRGPLSFRLDEGMPKPAGSAGGLAATLYPLLTGSNATWMFSVMSEADRAARAAGLFSAEGLTLTALEPDPDTYRMAYDVVANSTLWFLHHHLFDLTHRPTIDRRWHEAWAAYRSYNTLFAQSIMAHAPEGATVLVQDYHLALLPGLLTDSRPDLRSVHFTHTPFADPSALGILPEAVARELLGGMAAATACGFHTERWEQAFLACCTAFGIRSGKTFSSPLSPDAPSLLKRASAEECVAAAERLETLLGDRRLLLRVDRMEPAKNLLRGFQAFDELLTTRPEWRERVVLLAHAYTSRETLPEYLSYAAEVQYAVEHLNTRFGTEGWTPVLLNLADNPAASLAALTRYDVLLVNPVRDGLNLVAKEGPLVNQREGVLALSREAGAAAELGDHALEINPFDVSDTADALHKALTMAPAERAARATALQGIIRTRRPESWLKDQLMAAS
jgi:trehalose 6-phosphate synthase